MARMPSPVNEMESERSAARGATKRAAGGGSSSRTAPDRWAEWLASPWARGGLSLLLALHVTAVFTAPMRIPPMNEPPASPLFVGLEELFRTYLDATYLNHGYGFFSPDPGPSFLIRYQITLPDGTLKEGVYPDLDDQWPRLRYHRHFMLTSQVEMMPGLPESYLRHLQKKHNATHVRLEYVEHQLATPEQVLEGLPLDDPSLYRLIGTATIDGQGRAQVFDENGRLLTPVTPLNTEAFGPGAEMVPTIPLEHVPAAPMQVPVEQVPVSYAPYGQRSATPYYHAPQPVQRHAYEYQPAPRYQGRAGRYYQ